MPSHSITGSSCTEHRSHASQAFPCIFHLVLIFSLKKASSFNTDTWTGGYPHGTAYIHARGGGIYTEVRDTHMGDLQGSAWLPDILHMHIERTSSSQFKNQRQAKSVYQTERKSKVWRLWSPVVCAGRELKRKGFTKAEFYDQEGTLFLF